MQSLSFLMDTSLSDGGGVAGGYTEEALNKLAQIAKEEDVNEIIVESSGEGCLTPVYTCVI